MGNPTGSRFSLVPPIDAAIVFETAKAHALLKSYLRAELPFSKMREGWEETKASLERIGYRLKLIEVKDKGIVVEVERIGARQPFEPERFCRCGAAATKLALEQLWCESCLYAFWQEVLR